MGKHQNAEATGQCYNCDEIVGKENLVVNIATRWPVCENCDHELEQDCEEDEW